MASKTKTIDLREFKRDLKKSRPKMRRFLNLTAKKTPRGINQVRPDLEKKVWKEVDCLSCANCCKKMTPTFTTTDLKRISAHFKQTPDEFKKKWLEKDSKKDWVNRKQPCQFLNLSDNKCSIYAIRPVDCSGFPHLSLKGWSDYAHIYKQNIDYCPATFKMVEKLMDIFDKKAKA